LRVPRKGWQGGQEAPGHEDGARIQNGPSFHRQVDTEGFIFTKNKTLPARAVAPPTWKRLATDAYENSSQSRIDGINR
jgi:hypothetical protein